MIVAALEIENYKQYAGSHRIDLPEQGIVAVTGPNGAGKTTLFEAIEWCLYCPRSIPLATVPPHDGVGHTLVRVTLEDPNDGQRYSVERRLRSGKTDAEVYLEDAPEQPLVQGTREVSRYVATRLIGLPYAAFVSTFFTKQKELLFFADRPAAERRTEVGKLLGLEAVREAQREMGEGRTVARSLAEARRGEYERRLGERDLAAEALEAARVIAAAEMEEAAAEAAETSAATEADSARGEMDRLRDVQGHDAALGQQLAELAGALAAAMARRDGAVAQLARLEARAGERMPLAALAGDLDRWAAEVERLERERERARQCDALREAQGAAVEKECAVARRLEQLVNEQREEAQEFAGWMWTVGDAADPGDCAARLHTIAAGLDPEAMSERLAGMQEAVQRANAAREAATSLEKYRRLRDTLLLERDGLLADGDPALAVAEADRLVREAREVEQLERMALATARAERKDNEGLAAGLRQHKDDPACPTCSRPLGAKEAERLTALLDGRIRQLATDERAHLDNAQAAASRVKSAEGAEAEARTRQDAIRSLNDRLGEGQRVIAEAEGRYEEANEQVRAALAAIGAASVPSPEEIEAVRLQAERMRRIAALTGLLERLHDDARAARQAKHAAAESIVALGEVTYDEPALQGASNALREARRAAAQVELIDVELAHRGAYEEERNREDRELEHLGEQKSVLTARRRELGFDATALAAAQQHEQAARGAAYDRREEHAAVRQVVRDAQAERNRIAADHDQLQTLIEEADHSAREADELTRMYDEFAEFDRYVARHVGPLLEETTERMLSQVTNGKYDHVQFDENYGIEVFDGEESFPLSSFSGGEQDVVALCARLALSEVVGSAATRPPRFLVLDEVFGSLDSERRTQLLESLGSLAAGGHFQQMFIISHVDDVQQSPVMSEAWTIVERDGVSRVVRQGEIELAALQWG